MDHIEAFRAFVGVVELGTFTATARMLRVKQSTVSKWISQLEGELREQLFVRSTRSVELTDSGRLLYPHALEVLGAYESALSALGEHHGELVGRLRLSLPVVFGARHVTPLLPRFLDAHPRVELELYYDDRYINLGDAQIDVALRVGRAVDSALISRRIAETPRRLVASEAYLRHHPAPSTPDDLELHDCLLHTGMDPWRFEADGEEYRVRAHGRVAANNSAALLDLALHGQGVALLASWLVDDAIATGELQVLLPGYRPPTAPIQALTRPVVYQAPRTRALLDFLSDALAPLGTVR